MAGWYIVLGFAIWLIIGLGFWLALVGAGRAFHTAQVARVVLASIQQISGRTLRSAIDRRRRRRPGSVDRRRRGVPAT